MFMKKELVVLHDCSGIINFSNNQASAFLSCFVSDWYQPPPCLKNMDMSQVKIKLRLKYFKAGLILNFLCVSLRVTCKEIYSADEILSQMKCVLCQHLQHKKKHSCSQLDGCLSMVSFRGQFKLEPHPHWSRLGV